MDTQHGNIVANVFMGPLIPLFWTSGDISSMFQSQSGQLYLPLDVWCDAC